MDSWIGKKKKKDFVKTLKMEGNDYQGDKKKERRKESKVLFFNIFSFIDLLQSIKR